MSTVEKLLGLISDKKKRDVAFLAGGMLSLLGGRKIVGLSLFAKGALGLEKTWRAEHADFDGDFSQRWQRAIDFYEATHEHPLNRKLHIAGIPVILGGTVGLLLFRPYRPAWFVAAGAFTTGWVMNFIGHAIEKKAPAFADDPLSFVAGPAWDLQQVFGRRKAGRTKNGETIFDAAADAPPA
jgi:hypothetical protein